MDAVVELVLAVGAVNFVARCTRSGDQRVFASSLVYIVAMAGRR